MPLPGVRNEPVTDFSLEANRTAMQSAPAQGRRGRRERGKDFPLVIGGQRLTTYDKFYSRNPSNVDEIVAVLHKASPREVERAVETADRAFPSWSRVPAPHPAAPPAPLGSFAGETLRYARVHPLAPHPQEYPEYTYLPLGVGAVIPPWNF